jgi:hypothetical protein
MSLCDDYLTATASPEEQRLWGDTVTLRRSGNLTTTGVTAVWQRPQAEAVDSEGLRTDYDVRKFVIAKTAYAFAGTAETPRASDKITDADGTWQVLPDGESRAWWSDGDDWILNAKRVA